MLNKPLNNFAIPLLILFFALVFFMLIVSTKEKPPKVVINEHVWRVEQIEVKKQTLAPALTLYGQLESSELLNAAAPAASQVAKVLVKEGQTIQKGQLMLSLDKADFEPLLRQAQAKVNELNAQLESEQLLHKSNLKSLKNEQKLLKLSEKELARKEQVKRQNLGSVSETEQAMQKVETQRLAYIKTQFSVQEHESRQQQLEARLIQAQADLEKARLALERSQIYAPFSGVVAKVNVAQGDRVNANEKLLSFYSTEHLEIRAKLPVNRLAEIQQSIHKGETLSGFAFSGDAGSAQKERVPLQLERISGEAQASGVDAIFSIDADEVYYRIGAIVVVRLQRSARDNLIKVPYQAMYGSDRLYQIKDNRLQAVKVRSIGESFDSSAENADQPEPALLIESGALKNGDAILTTHLPNAFSGLKVEVVK